MTKQFGFNMTRKHIKVEPARWYYWADKLGLLVWQDMPCGWGSGKGADGAKDGVPQSPEAARQFELELRTMVDQHANSPAVILWVVFNESWGQYDTPRLTRMVKDLDPTRLVTGGSGWFRAPCGDAIDVHHYLMRYVEIPLSAAAAACLQAGKNTIAIHAEKPVAEKPDNQFIDVGLGDETITWQSAELPRR